MIGLGYVGLPLAVYLARHFPVLGFDIDAERVAELSQGIDRTREVTKEEFAQAGNVAYSADGRSGQAPRFERTRRRKPRGGNGARQQGAVGARGLVFALKAAAAR